MVEDLSMSKNENKSNFLTTKDPQLPIVLEELTDKKFDELMEELFSHTKTEKAFHSNNSKKIYEQQLVYKLRLGIITK